MELLGLEKDSLPTASLNALFVLRYNVPVNNLSFKARQIHHFLGIHQYCGGLMCLAQGHNMALQTKNLLIPVSEPGEASRGAVNVKLYQS